MTCSGEGQALHSLSRRSWLVAAAGAALTAACGRAAPKARLVPAGATVLALGDSITFGTGASLDTSYPAHLARLAGWKVVNAGVPGDTSAQALERLPALLQDHAPQLVIVSIGGNDLLRRMNESDTRANIRRICEQAAAGGAQVLLVAVPRPTLAGAALGSLADHPMYAEIAAELKLPLQRQGWADVLEDERLRSDPIHANAQGYEQFAKSLVATARGVGLLPR